MKRFFIALLLVACGEKPAPVATTTTAAPPVTPPTVAEATEIIGNTGPLGEFEFDDAAVTIPLTNAGANPLALAVATDLERTGWITVDEGTVTLTEKAKHDKRFLVRQNGVVDIVPLAKKEMGAARSVTPAADGEVQVTFSWRWIPNEIGRELKALEGRYAGEQNATATLIREGAGWAVLRIRR
jgi:hypothetical protein